MMENGPFRILLAEDDADDRLVFQTALEDIRMKVDLQMVNDGVELMDYLATTTEPLPHLLFLDLNMPRKGGMQCLEEIRADNNLKELLIVIFSTSASEKDIEETFVKGANIYIQKPDTFGKLKERLKHVISINWQYHTSGLNKENFLLSM